LKIRIFAGNEIADGPEYKDFAKSFCETEPQEGFRGWLFLIKAMVPAFQVCYFFQ